RPGPLLAAVDFFEITLTGRGGHAAHPETTADPVAAALALGQALQTVVSRNVAAQDQAVLSLTAIHAGSAPNIVPETARMLGTVRPYRAAIRDLIETRMGEICEGVAAAMRVDARLDYRRLNQATVNDAQATAFALDVAREISGEAGVDG